MGETYRIILKSVNPDRMIVTITAIRDTLSLPLKKIKDAFDNCRQTKQPQILQEGFTEDEVLQLTEELQTNLRKAYLDPDSIDFEAETLDVSS